MGIGNSIRIGSIRLIFLRSYLFFRSVLRYVGQVCNKTGSHQNEKGGSLKAAAQNKTHETCETSGDTLRVALDQNAVMGRMGEDEVNPKVDSKGAEMASDRRNHAQSRSGAIPLFAAP